MERLSLSLSQQIANLLLLRVIPPWMVLDEEPGNHWSMTLLPPHHPDCLIQPFS